LLILFYDKNKINFFVQVIASEILWFAQNKFLISLSHEDEQNNGIEIYYVEINVKDYKCTKCVNYCDLAFPSQQIDGSELSSYFKVINEWYFYQSFSG
jgi:uncharacterized protein (UPF0212 family)